MMALNRRRCRVALRIVVQREKNRVRRPVLFPRFFTEKQGRPRILRMKIGVFCFLIDTLQLITYNSIFLIATNGVETFLLNLKKLLLLNGINFQSIDAVSFLNNKK